MDESSWDLFAARSQPESLWFAYQLAKGLADRGQMVRLFSDQLDELKVALPEIDANLWIQSHKGFEIADCRVAQLSVVSRHVVQMFDSHIPVPYWDRLESQPVPTCSVQIVSHGSEREPTNPITVLEKNGSCTSFLAQVGDLPRRAGYIKFGRRGAVMRQLWRKRDVRKGMFSALGLPDDVADDKITVFFDVRDAGPFGPWLTCWNAGERDVCVFVEREMLQSEPSIVATGQVFAGGLIRQGNVTIVPLPPRRWFLTDELIWACDVVMTTRSDIAARATESGTPVIWGADDDSSFFDWYAANATEVIRRTVVDAFDALVTGKNVEWAWTCYMARWDDMHALAGKVSQRILRAPDMVDVLIAGISDAQREAVGRMFAPTMPGEVA